MFMSSLRLVGLAVLTFGAMVLLPFVLVALIALGAFVAAMAVGAAASLAGWLALGTPAALSAAGVQALWGAAGFVCVVVLCNGVAALWSARRRRQADAPFVERLA